MSEPGYLIRCQFIKHILKKDIAWVLSNQPIKLKSKQLAKLNSYIARYNSGEPKEYIIGETEFWSNNFKLNKHTLIPRHDTEILVELAIKTAMQKKNQIKILELGTGTGAIGISIAKELPLSFVYATDISTKALNIANKNAKIHNVKNIEFLKSDWFDSIGDQKFDLIVSNPPYVSKKQFLNLHKSICFEPKIALLAEENGFSCLKKIALDSKKYMLDNGGTLILEHGYNQGSYLSGFLRNTYGACVSIFEHFDIGGIWRATSVIL